MNFNLKLLIDTETLPIIRDSGQRITLAKPVNADTTPSVVWLSIDPFASTDVSWEEQYGIYASTTKVVDGATISKLSETGVGAQDGATYTFTSGAVFNGPFPGGVPRGSYGAQNDMPSSLYPVLTFGLTQDALVNQVAAKRKPLSATPVLATQFAEITPFTIVFVWLQAQFRSETIITRITGRNTKVRLGGGVNEATLKYNAELGVFVPVDSKGTFQKESALATIDAPLLF
jgi:hypothetical protein